MNAWTRAGRGPLRSPGASAAVLPRLVDAFWISFAHYFAHILYPWTTRLLLAMGITSLGGSTQQQPWTTLNTLASVMAIVAFQVVAEGHTLYRSWQGVPLRREVFTALGAWVMSIPFLLFFAFVTKTSEIYSRSISLVWFFGTGVALGSWRVAMHALLFELRKRGGYTRSVAIAGATDVALSLAKTM